MGCRFTLAKRRDVRSGIEGEGWMRRSSRDLIGQLGQRDAISSDYETRLDLWDSIENAITLLHKVLPDVASSVDQHAGSKSLSLRDEGPRQ